MQFINEYVNRILKHRVLINLKRTDCVIPSSWDVSYFINQLGSICYKLELLNSIGLAINEGISPKNIFVLNRSFALNNSYSSLGNLQLNTSDIAILYRIGLPICFFPNDTLQDLSFVFRFFRGIKEVIDSRNLRLPSSLMASYFNENLKFSDFVDMLYELLKVNNKEKKEKFQKLSIKFKKEANSYHKQYKYLDQVSKYILTYGKTPDNNAENKFDSQFFNCFNRVSRPLVGIYYPDGHFVQILGLAHINRKKRNATFFDLKGISHNSPWKAIVEGGVSLLELAQKRDLIKLQEEKLKKEIELTNEMIKTETIKQDSIRLSNIEKVLEIQQKYDLQEIAKVENNYLKHQLEYEKNRALLGYNNVLKKNKTIVENIQIIDVNV